jgi:hypothetical protein
VEELFVQKGIKSDKPPLSKNFKLHRIGMNTETCSVCTTVFNQEFNNQRFCSKTCRKSSYKERLSLGSNQKVAFPLVETIPLPSPASSAKLRITAVLDEISDEQLHSLAGIGPRYSESTLRKHVWVQKIYEAFSKRSNIDCWPLKGKNVTWFIRFLGLEVNYAIGSIEDVIIPSLKRIHRQSTGREVSTKLSKLISQALKHVKTSSARRKGSEGKDAAIYADIERIIEMTPVGLPTKPAEASLWLTAVSTGSRAVTCFHVNVGDIERVIRPLDNSARLLVQVKLRVTKGNPFWNHTVTLEGDPGYASSMNVVYWLQCHLRQTFGVDLLSHHTWQESVKAKKLWPWSKDGMRQLFKKRASLAGFPYHIFSFHSLRSGFLCSSLL